MRECFGAGDCVYTPAVVRTTYKPLTSLDVLPELDADGLARAIVDGRERKQRIAAPPRIGN
jgi:hypothetical protein